MHILFIEDDPSVSQTVKLMLELEGFNVQLAATGEDGVDLARVYDYDVILLDLTLPDMSGMEVLRAARTAKVTSPVIVVSGASDIGGKVDALRNGADDYVTKPFHKAELVARMQAVARRAMGHADPVIDIGPLSVNLNAKTAAVNGVVVHLTRKEYQLLELLALRKGSTLTKEVFLNHLYGGMDEPEAKIIDVFICKLRKKLAEALGGERLIETIWGRGYMIRDPQPQPLAA